MDEKQRVTDARNNPPTWTGTLLLQIAKGRWGGRQVSANLRGCWENIDDIEIGPEVQFYSPELLGNSGVIYVFDQLPAGSLEFGKRPSHGPSIYAATGLYFGRYILRSGGVFFRRCIDIICHRDGILIKAEPSPDLAGFTCDNQAVMVDELVNLAWAVHLIAIKLAGKRVHEAVRWGTRLDWELED